MWVAALHLLFGNFVIGIGEAWILRRLFGARLSRAVPLLVAANYLSMIAGSMVLPFTSGPALELAGGGIDSVPAALAILAAGSFALTLVLEWPFCYAALGKRPLRLRDSILGNLAAQSASYAVLGLIYLAVSKTSLGDLRFSRELVRTLDPATTVFFIGADDGALWRIGLDGSGREKLAEIDPRPASDERLTAKAGEGGFRIAVGGIDLPLQPLPSADWIFDEGPCGDLRPEPERGWHVLANAVLGEGLRARRESTGESLHLALETPILNLLPKNATVLPGDIVVVQIRNEIYVIDLNRRMIGPLTRGRGPLVGIRRHAP